MATAYPFARGTPPEGRLPLVSVTVYTLPLCARSIATMRDLTQHGIAFTEVDLSSDVAARASVQALGYMRAPVVVAGTDHWAGYNPEAISRIARKTGTLRRPADFRMVDAPLTRR